MPAMIAALNAALNTAYDIRKVTLNGQQNERD
jgi:hypothetical protein